MSTENVYQTKRIIMSTCPNCNKTASGDWLVKEGEDFIVKCNRCSENFTLVMLGSGIVIPVISMGERNDV